jgi:hypothetical protein
VRGEATAIQQALAADSPVSALFGKLRGLAAEAQRYALLTTVRNSLNPIMNKKQWIILSVAVVVLSLSAMFPPWLYQCDWRSFSGGYHFFVRSPKIEAICLNSDPLPGPPPTIHMNVDRLVLQSVVVVVLTVGLLLILKTPRTNFSIVTAAIIGSIGAVGLMFLGLMIHFEK